MVIQIGWMAVGLAASSVGLSLGAFLVYQLIIETSNLDVNKQILAY
jgi:hypothetical protein